MTNEEIQKTMDFVIKQQEHFAESMEKAYSRMNRVGERVCYYFQHGD